MANLKDAADSRTALLWFSPSRLKIKAGLNGRDMSSPENITHIEEVAASIAEHGFMQSKPLEIFSEGDDIFVSDGHIRHSAVELCISRGVVVEKVPCVPEARGTNDADRILNQSVHNSGKRLSPIEEGRNIKRAIALGRTVAEVAAKIGRSLTYVNQALDFQAAPAEVHKLVTAGEISATLAAKTIRREGNEAGTATIKKAVAEAKANGKAKATAKHLDSAAIEEAVGGAVDHAIETLGVDALKATSLFGSNNSAADPLREAARAVVDAFESAAEARDMLETVNALRDALDADQ